MRLYPLKFKPILKSTIWGGSKLGKILGKPVDDLDTCGESWEISGVTGNNWIQFRISLTTADILESPFLFLNENFVRQVDLRKPTMR